MMRLKLIPLLVFMHTTALSQSDSALTPENDSRRRKYKKQLVGINLLHIYYNSLSFHYEHFSYKTPFSIKFPLSIGIAKNGTENLMHRNKIASVGVDINGYFDREDNVNIFMGVGYEFGKYRYYLPSSLSIKKSESQPLQIFYNCFVYNFGIMFWLPANINLSLMGALGVRFDRPADFFNYSFVPLNHVRAAWNLGLNIGYRF
jgi:hypothetical protein